MLVHTFSTPTNYVHGLQHFFVYCLCLILWLQWIFQHSQMQVSGKLLNEWKVGTSLSQLARHHHSSIVLSGNINWRRMANTYRYLEYPCNISSTIIWKYCYGRLRSLIAPFLKLLEIDFMQFVTMKEGMHLFTYRHKVVSMWKYYTRHRYNLASWR